MPTKTLTVQQFFGKKGLLSEWHPNYEYRDGQLEMAAATMRGLALLDTLNPGGRRNRRQWPYCREQLVEMFGANGLVRYESMLAETSKLIEGRAT